MAGWTIDAAEVADAGIDFETADSGQSVAPGWHLFELHDVYEDPNSGDMVFDCRITSEGPSKGGRIFQRLRSRENSQHDKDGGKFNLKCICGNAKRLGLWNGDAAALASLDFTQAIGFQGVLHTFADSYEDRKVPGKMVEKVKVEAVGFYAPSHPHIPVVVRQQLGLPLLPGQQAPGAVPATGGRGKAAQGGAARAAGGGAASSAKPGAGAVVDDLAAMA